MLFCIPIEILKYFDGNESKNRLRRDLYKLRLKKHIDTHIHFDSTVYLVWRYKEGSNGVRREGVISPKLTIVLEEAV